MINFLTADKYGFITLQEYQDIDKDDNPANKIRNKLLPIYGERSHKDGSASITTFYDKLKYSEIYSYFGNIDEHGRPYSVIFYKDLINTTDNYIVINLHAKHWPHSPKTDINKKSLIKALEKDSACRHINDIPDDVIKRNFYVMVCNGMWWF